MLRWLNPLSPHDALKHHFTYLKTDLIFLEQRVLERKFPQTRQFYLIFKPHQIIFIHYKSRIATAIRGCQLSAHAPYTVNHVFKGFTDYPRINACQNNYLLSQALQLELNLDIRQRNIHVFYYLASNDV